MVVASREHADLYRKLVWVTFFRVVIITVLLGATAVLTFTERESLTGPVQDLLYRLTVAVYIASLAYLLVLRRGGVGSYRALAYVQVLGDVALATFLTWVTGGRDSVFSFLYSLAVINAAILLYRRGAFVAAGASALAYLGLTAGLNARWVPPAAPYLARARLSTPRVVFNTSIIGGAFFLVGGLASYLTEQVRRTGVRLSEAEEDFAALAALHERIVQSVASGILTLDGKGAVTFVNRTGEELLAKPLAQMRHRELGEVFPELGGALTGLAVPGAHRGEVGFERDGEERTLGFTVSPLSAVAGADARGRVVIFQDLTALRRMETLVQRNERLAAIGSLAAGLAHELRNPLASVSGSVDLLRHSLPDGATEGRLMDIVLRETERLDHLIGDFLTFARPTPPTFAEVPMHRLVSETVEMFRNDPTAAEAKVEVAVPETLQAWCDEGQVRQVLLNLLINAVQATGGTGHIQIEGSPDGDDTLIAVADDGPGIDPDRARRIFDPFYTTKERGTGLGLALVHRILEAHGGGIELESAPGRGSRFLVRLMARAPSPGV